MCHIYELKSVVQRAPPESEFPWTPGYDRYIVVAVNVVVIHTGTAVLLLHGRCGSLSGGDDALDNAGITDKIAKV